MPNHSERVVGGGAVGAAWAAVASQPMPAPASKKTKRRKEMRLFMVIFGGE